jgi:type VI secretion system protein ImpA
MTTPLLDFDALLAPIEGEQPAGMRLAPDVRKKIEDARKEFEPDPEDPSKPPIVKKPDWSLIVKLTTTNLSTKSKDLLAGIRLTEALTKQHKFVGLRDGLKFLRLLITDCWDRMHPIIEEPDDIESRAGSFEWLLEPESGAWFPASISHLPLVKTGGQIASYADCQSGKLDGKPVDLDTLKSSVPIEPTTAEEIASCLEELDLLNQALGDKMAHQAPSVVGMRQVLTGCQSFLAHLTVTGEASSEETPTESTSGGTESSTPKSGGAMNRAEAYRQLGMLADKLAVMEPHSPIPDLLRWAVKLGGMPFKQLIREFVRNSDTLEDIRRQFGIKEENQEQTY